MIELACIADARYLRHSAAMLHSALSHCAPGSVSASVLHTGLIDASERARLEQVTGRFAARLRFVPMDDRLVADLPAGTFARNVWLRIFLPDLMPDHDKVLYLDSDLIVTDDLRPLWDTALGDHLVAAVTNPMYPFMPPYPRTALGLPRAEDYFNSGVLLMNLPLMRRENTRAALQEFARANPWVGVSGAADQDAFSVVCRGRRLPLHPRWNVQTTFFDLKAALLPFPSALVSEALARPAVIHFIGASKPWNYLCRHPRRALYFEHARATPWGEPALAGRTLRNFVLRQLPPAWTYRWADAERALRSAWRAARSGR